MLNWIKKMFSGGDEPSDIVTDVSIEHLSHESIISNLKLKNTGIREGNSGNPPTSATTEDQHEKDIYRKFDVNKQKNQRKISDALNINSNSLISAKQTIDHPKEGYKRIPIEAKEKLHVHTYERKEKKVKEKIKIFDSNLSTFKQENDRIEEAHYVESFIFHYAILFILFIGETLINGQFFGPTVAGGLVQGITIAAFISIINVGLSILLGAFVFPETNHVVKTKRMWGYIGVVIIIAILIFWNLYIAHFRTLFDENIAGQLGLKTAEMNLKVWDHMSKGLLSSISQEGLTLFGVGSLICIMVFIKSYTADDKYPNYGRITRRVRDAENELERMYRNWADLVHDVYERANKHGSNVKKNINSRIRSWRKYIEACEKIVGKHINLIDELEKNINLCLDTYRGSNIAARKASNSPNPPKYFDKKFEYDQKERDYKIIYRDSLQDVALLNEPEKKNKANNDYIEINNSAHTDISKILESDREKMLHHFGKLKDIMKKPPTPSAPIVRLVDKENQKMD